MLIGMPLTSESPSSVGADNSTVGLFDWLNRGRARGASSTIVWQVQRDGDQLTIEDGRGASYRVQLGGARFVRVVPLTGGQAHVTAQQSAGWQVALSQRDGDRLVGKPLGDWRVALDLARLLCDRAGLPLEETTERMFSRVGQFSPPDPNA
jgi:hypothetical protein